MTALLFLHFSVVEVTNFVDKSFGVCYDNKTISINLCGEIAFGSTGCLNPN